MTSNTGRLLWTPSPRDAQLDKFRRMINKKYGLSLEDYWELHNWSVKNHVDFWKEAWHYVGIIHSKTYDQVVDTSVKFEDVPEWFKGVELNYAENLLRYNDDGVALYETDESRQDYDVVTYAELHRGIAQYAAALKKLGLKPGDIVGAYIANSSPAAQAMLAATSLGCVWCAVSLEFGAHGMLDRMKQIQPKVLFFSDYSLWDGEETNYLERLEIIVKELPTLEKVIIVPFYKHKASDGHQLPISCSLKEFLELGQEADGSVPPLEFVQLPFSHPVFISFTSGTTGPPKVMVHSAGGVLLPAFTEFVLYREIPRSDVLECFSPVGWSVWNNFVTHLATGSAILLYEGHPMHPKTRIFDLMDQLGVTTLLGYPVMFTKCEAAGLIPKKSHSLSTLQHIIMCASCPKPQNWDYIRKDVKPGVHVISAIGATDLMGFFAGFNHTLPIHHGEIVAPHLGMALECYDETGKSVLSEKGELVFTRPFPSMPLYFCNDPEGEKYRKTYFSKFPGVFSLGDFIMINHETKGIITLGRSDAVLKPDGDRFGTAEMYNVVESIKGIQDSVCVSRCNKDFEDKVVLFLKMAPGYLFSEEVVRIVNEKIKNDLTYFHCPSLILEAKDLPYTVTGKKAEMAVKKAINGEEILYKQSIANPESLNLYYNIPELQDL